MLKNKAQICAFLLCLGAMGIIAYYAFVTVNCLAYPWWVGLGSDGDGTYVTQTLLLLNNGPLELIFHPGASAYGLLGIILRIIGNLDPTHAFLSLSAMQNPVQVFAMLDHAMHVSRLVVVILNMICLLLFWRVLYQLSKNLLIALGLSAFFMTTYFMMEQRAFIIRPEIFSFFYMLLCVTLLISTQQRLASGLSVGIFRMMGIGILAGLAFLAKFQTLPLIACLFIWWVFATSSKFQKNIETRILWVACASAVVNIVIMPWSWLKRPDFLLDFLKNLYYLREEHQLYGPAPASVAPVYAVVLFLLLAISLAAACIRHPYQNIVARYLIKINFFITGFIASCYLVFLGLGQSMAAYVAASNHLLYSVTTNVLYGGAANHRMIDHRTFEAIVNVHNGSQILGVSVLWYVVAAACFCFIRLLRSSTERNKYGLVLLVFAIGLTMDILSTFRQYSKEQVIIVASYAIYSLSVYCCGLALLCALEMQVLRQRLGKMQIQTIVSFALMFNMLIVANHVWRLERWDVVNHRGQNAQQEMLNTTSQVPGFWHMVSQGKI